MKDIITQSHAPHITNDPFPARQGYKWTEVGVIPEDWEIQRLEAICSVYSGGTPSTARHDFYGGHIPWITSGDLNARRITEVSNYLTQAGFDSSAAKMVKSGDLVVALYGATAGVVAITEIEAAINQAVLAIKTNRCDSEYLFHHLASRRNQIVATYTQGGQPNLSGEIIRSLVIVIPPLAEQRAIAEALSDIDGLLNALEALITKKQAIKQVAMQQLLTGKTRLPGFSGAWETKRLGEIGTFTKGRGIKRDDVSAEGLPCVRYGELYTRYQDYILKVMSRIPPRIAATALPIKTGDLLFAGSGETAEEIGYCAAYLGEEQAYAGGDVIVLTPSGHNSMYLGHLMNSSIVSAQKARLGQGDAVVHIYINNLAQVQIELPSITEQNAIASVLSDMDAEIASLEQRRDKTRAIKQGMMQQLLTGRVRLVKEE